MSRKIEVQILGDSRSLEAALGRSQSSVQRLGQNMQRAGATMTRYMTLPLVALGGVAVKTAADFDSSLEKIQGLVGANTKQMAGYRKSILALAPAVAKGPKELADALYFVTSSGFKGAQALDILRQSAKASTAGLGDTQQIADLVTSAMTAYGAKTLDAAKATDILVAATKAGKGDPQEFAQALQLNVAAANTLGISFDQLAAATAALSTVNSNVAEDATQLSGIMSALIKPSAMATAQLKKMGLTAGELRAEVRDKGLLTTLQDLKDKTHGNVEEIGKLFPNVRGLRGFLTLVGKAANRNVSIFDQVAHSTGDMNKAFQTALTNDPTAQFNKMKAQLQVLAIIVGETLIPALTSFAGTLVGLADKFRGLSSGQQHAILIAAGFLAVIGPIVGVVGTLITVVTAAAGAFRALAAGELLAAGPIVLIVVGLAAIAAGLIYAYRHSETFHHIVNVAFHAVRGAVEAVVGVLRGPLSDAFNIVKRIAGKVIDFIHDHWKIIATIIGGPVVGAMILIVTHLGTIRDKAGAVLEFLRNKWNTVTHAIRSSWNWIQNVIDKISSLVSWIGRIHWPSPPGWLTGSVLDLVGGSSSSASTPGRGGGGRSNPSVAFGGMRSGGNVVIPVHIDGREVFRAVVQQDKVFRRQNGRGALA